MSSKKVFYQGFHQLLLEATCEKSCVPPPLQADSKCDLRVTKCPVVIQNKLNQIYEHKSFRSDAAAAAAAAKSPQSCLTLCDPMDSSPPGSPVPGILQARTLEWVEFLIKH